MKTYRQPIRKTESVRRILFPIFYGAFIPILFLLGNPYIINLIYIYLGVLAFFGLVSTTSFFYLKITEDTLIIQNLVYRHWGNQYSFCDIEKVEIGNTGGYTLDYIRVYTTTKKSRRYVINLVNPKEYPNLIEDLESKGVKVEVKGIKVKRY